MVNVICKYNLGEKAITEDEFIHEIEKDLNKFIKPTEKLKKRKVTVINSRKKADKTDG